MAAGTIPHVWAIVLLAGSTRVVSKVATDVDVGLNGMMRLVRVIQMLRGSSGR